MSHTRGGPDDDGQLGVLAAHRGEHNHLTNRAFAEAGHHDVGVLGAAALYIARPRRLRHAVGEMTFLFGLGVVYAIAYRLVDSILVLWPLLTPIRRSRPFDDYGPTDQGAHFCDVSASAPYASASEKGGVRGPPCLFGEGHTPSTQLLTTIHDDSTPGQADVGSDACMQPRRSRP